MPLQKQKSARLLLVAPPMETADDFDDLIGPAQMRPGELHERYPLAVPAAFVRAARMRGVSASLAVSVVCERQLAIDELAACGLTVGRLDDAARRAVPRIALSELMSDYARTLVAAISGPIEGEPAQGPAVIPARLECRVLAANVVQLDPAQIDVALWWELAAVVGAATMTEWALRQALASALYSSPAAGQVSAAASTAR